jgi:hypothetical protein
MTGTLTNRDGSVKGKAAAGRSMTLPIFSFLRLTSRIPKRIDGASFPPGVPRMLCWALRTSLIGRLVLAVLFCVALTADAAAATRAATAHTEDVSISLRSPALPLAALGATAALRFEKQAHSVRLTIPRPDRSAGPSWGGQPQAASLRVPAHHIARVLPRRLLLPRHASSRPPDESADPALAHSSLS